MEPPPRGGATRARRPVALVTLFAPACLPPSATACSLVGRVLDFCVSLAGASRSLNLSPHLAKRSITLPHCVILACFYVYAAYKALPRTQNAIRIELPASLSAVRRISSHVLPGSVRRRSLESALAAPVSRVIIDPCSASPASFRREPMQQTLSPMRRVTS